MSTWVRIHIQTDDVTIDTMNACPARDDKDDGGTTVGAVFVDSPASPLEIARVPSAYTILNGPLKVSCGEGRSNRSFVPRS